MRGDLLLMIVPALLLACGCGGAPSPKAAAGVASTPSVLPLPDDEAEGWEQDIPDNPVKYYSRENLYLYLGQKADLYNDYGFLKLSHATYRPNLLGRPSVTVDVYKMDLPLDAYGIFSVERKCKDMMINVGGAAHVGPDECTFWKGSYFVRIRGVAPLEEPEKVFASFATRTANNIQGTTAVPELALFPPENRVIAGDSYYADDLLGYKFLGRGFTVEYDLDGSKATMFLAVFPPEVEKRKKSEASAEPPLTVTTAAYIELRRSLLKDGETPVVLPGPWEHGYRATEPKLGPGLVVRQGRYIAGIFGAPNEEVALGMTAFLAKQLPQ